jgi:hypothetical protein
VFNGRSYYQSLVTISQTASLNNTLDYAFAVGNAGIGNASSSYLTSRTVDMGGLSSSSISSAELHAIYTYGTSGLDDAMLLNGTRWIVWPLRRPLISSWYLRNASSLSLPNGICRPSSWTYQALVNFRY